ncbi:hypothetical protein MTP99_014336 [Tenebrio molitor]|nr:hypothetical protein MTP99_014336 [Tenebrio molitor]
MKAKVNSQMNSFSAYLSGNVKSTVWCLDSGASEHLVKSGNHVSNIQKLEHSVCIKIAKSGVTLKTETFGEFRGKSVVGNKVYNTGCFKNGAQSPKGLKE